MERYESNQGYTHKLRTGVLVAVVGLAALLVGCDGVNNLGALGNNKNYEQGIRKIEDKNDSNFTKSLQDDLSKSDSLGLGPNKDN